MNQQLNKKQAKKLLEIKGEVRGATLIGDKEYVLTHCGKDKLQKVEERLRSLDIGLDYEKINDLDFYPAGFRIISLLVIKEVCNLSEDDIKSLCFLQPKFSLVVKIFARFLLSPRKALEQTSKFWREYFTVGDLILKEFNEKEGYIIFQLKNFKIHPLYCKCLEGYIKGIVEMIVRNEKVECRETKCVFKGNPYHEFLVQWPVKKK